MRIVSLLPSATAIVCELGRSYDRSCEGMPATLRLVRSAAASPTNGTLASFTSRGTTPSACRASWAECIPRERATASASTKCPRPACRADTVWGSILI